MENDFISTLVMCHLQSPDLISKDYYIPCLGVVAVVVAAEEIFANQPLPERRREPVARVAALGRVPAVGVRVQVGDL